MKLHLLFFGFAAEIVGLRKMELDISSGAVTADLRLQLASLYPELKKIDTYVFAVNQQYADESVVLSEGDEVAIIPPVSGG